MKLTSLSAKTGRINETNDGMTLIDIIGSSSLGIQRGDLADKYDANTDIFNGMTIEIGGIERLLLTSSPSITTDIAFPDDVQMSDANFKIKSVFKSDDGLTQVDLECEMTSFGKCGGYSVQTGQYVMEDPFIRSPETKVESLAQGEKITLTCQDGYRVTEDPSCDYAAVDDDAAGICSTSKADADGGQGSYERECKGCNYDSTDGYRCVSVTCKGSMDLDQEKETVQFPSAIVRFGEKQVVNCKQGYMAGTKAESSRGINAEGSSNRYMRTCGTADDDYTNDYEFNHLSRDPGPCERVLCGVFSPPSDSTVLVKNTTLIDVAGNEPPQIPGWSTELEVVHGESIVVQCNAGYRRSDSASTFVSPCSDVITATCDTGNFVYDGSSAAPTCVPLTCGNPSVDKCGNETCDATMGFGVGVNLDLTDTTTALVSGGAQVVTCADGYRAQPVSTELVSPKCDDPQTYSRTCGWCIFDGQFSCQKVVCNASSSFADLSGSLSMTTSLFQEKTTVTCSRGYRAASITANPDEITSDLEQTYEAVCNASCSLDMQGRACRKVMCKDREIDNAVVEKSSPIAFGDIITYTCNAGYRRRGTTSTFSSPCNATIFARCDDGILMFSAGAPTYSTVEPVCEPFSGCGPNSVCGEETCQDHQYKDPNGRLDISGPSAQGRVTVKCNAGFAPAPVSDSLSNCNGSSGLKNGFVPPPGYDGTKNQYSLDCRYCNWEEQKMMCKPLSCQWSPELEPNGIVVSTFADDRLRIAQNENVTVDCNFGWRASSNSSGLAAFNDPRRFEMACAEAQCAAIRSTDVPASDLSCKSVACYPDALEVLNARVAAGNTATDDTATDETASLNTAAVKHGDFIEFECLPGFKSIFSTNCSATEPFYGICTDGKLVFNANNDDDPVMRGKSYEDKTTVCVPKTCPRLQKSLHPFTADTPAFARASSGPAGLDSWNADINCSDGYRVGPDPVLPNGPKAYQLLCEDCIWKPCVDQTGFVDSEGNSCEKWSANPTWCYGSPEDGAVDLPGQYANADGVDPSMACCACGGGGTALHTECQKGYCPHVHFETGNKFANIEGILQDNVFTSTEQLGAILDGLDDQEAILINMLMYGDSAKVRCREGYRIKGNNDQIFGTVTCTDSGLSPAPLEGICVPLVCDMYPGVVNSVENKCITDERTEANKICQDQCDDGVGDDCSRKRCHALCYAGDVACYCAKDPTVKKWFEDYDSEDCPLVCGPVDQWEYGTGVTVTCEDPFYLKGESCADDRIKVGQAICSKLGTWDSLPQCLPVPPDKSCTFDDPNAQTAVEGNTIAADEVEIQCKPGFVAVAAASAAVYDPDDPKTFDTTYNASCADCLLSTTVAGISTPEVHCMPVTCKAKDWSQGDPNIETWAPKDEPVSALSGVVISCKEGYRASSFQNPSAEFLSPALPRYYFETCQLDDILNEGESPTVAYSSTGSQCRKVMCGIPPALANSVRNETEISLKGVYSFGDTLSYTCVAGYHIKGPDPDACSKGWTATCTDDGTFDTRECVAVTCPVESAAGTLITQDIDGSRIPYNSGITYKCDFGFEVKANASNSLSAESRGTCQDDCTISAHLECIKKECVVPPRWDNGRGGATIPDDAAPSSNAANDSAVANANNATVEEQTDIPAVTKASFAETIPISCAESSIVSGSFFDDRCISTVYAQCLSTRQFTLLDEIQCVPAQCPNPSKLFASKEGAVVENAFLTWFKPASSPSAVSDGDGENTSTGDTGGENATDGANATLRSLWLDSDEDLEYPLIPSLAKTKSTQLKRTIEIGKQIKRTDSHPGRRTETDMLWVSNFAEIVRLTQRFVGELLLPVKRDAQSHSNGRKLLSENSDRHWNWKMHSPLQLLSSHKAEERNLSPLTRRKWFQSRLSTLEDFQLRAENASGSGNGTNATQTDMDDTADTADEGPSAEELAAAAAAAARQEVMLKVQGARPWNWGDEIYFQCLPGYVVSDRTCLRDGTCANYMKLQCGKSTKDGEACQWQDPPQPKCVQKNICRNYREWAGSTVTQRSVGSRSMRDAMRCPPGPAHSPMHLLKGW